MAEILLVNPRKRRRKGKRKMSALQRKYFGKRRTKRARAASPRRRRRRASAVAAAPRRRRRSYSVARRISRRRRNPSVRGVLSQVMPTAKSGLIGAAGGLVNDVAFGYVKTYLPAQLQTGLGRSAAKGLLAVLVGIAVNMVLRGKGRDMAVGAMTVVMHEAAKAQLSTMMPSLPLGEYDLGYVDAASVVQGMGTYLSGANDFVNDQVLGDSSASDYSPSVDVNNDILGEYLEG